ncbi:hypothetical protein EBU99_13235 [bacterium]|nr:hypothetical protein [bacterium]
MSSGAKLQIHQHSLRTKTTTKELSESKIRCARIRNGFEGFALTGLSLACACVKRHYIKSDVSSRGGADAGRNVSFSLEGKEYFRDLGVPVGGTSYGSEGFHSFYCLQFFENGRLTGCITSDGKKIVGTYKTTGNDVEVNLRASDANAGTEKKVLVIEGKCKLLFRGSGNRSRFLEYQSNIYARGKKCSIQIV